MSGSITAHSGLFWNNPPTVQQSADIAGSIVVATASALATAASASAAASSAASANISAAASAASAAGGVAANVAAALAASPVLTSPSMLSLPVSTTGALPVGVTAGSGAIYVNGGVLMVA